jgi:NitT/TauT family transport system permease protein
VLRRWVRLLLPPLVPLVLLLGLQEMAVRLGWVREFLVPAPSNVYWMMKENKVELSTALLWTSAGALAGFGLSVVVGLAAGVLLASSRWVQRAFYPYAVFFQTVPIIAIAPLLVIWIGYGLPTVIASAFIVSVFPVIANTLTGLLSTDPALRDMFRLYRAGPMATLVKLRLPAALPNILTGLRIAAGLAVIGAVVGEFITGGGLGGIVTVALTQQAVDKVFAAVLLASLLGLALFAAINLASWLALRRWHASESAR